MAYQISVEPLGDGWAVRPQNVENPLVFCSIRVAEATAKRLGAKLADAGHPVQIRFEPRGGAFGPIHLYLRAAA
ncbi:MAG TPA: hypothetical protein VHY34_10065 [Caulobacteraceae bacterium]|nr:hypothetical protein [Caulobacteraceae bacterium]